MSDAAPSVAIGTAAIRAGRFAGRGPGRWWLALPSRAAGLARSSARIALALVAVQALAVLLTPAAPVDGADGAAAAALADAARGGAAYYDTAADLVRGGALAGDALGVPLPSLATLLGIAGPLAPPLLPLLAATALVAWHRRLRAEPSLTRAGAWAATALLAVGLAGTLRPSLAALPEGWAGPFLLLALARRDARRVTEPAAWGLAAALAAPAALPALAALALAAWRGGERRQTAAGVLAAALALATLALHAHAVAGIADATVLPLGPLRLDVAGGMGALVRASGLGLLPVLPARLLGLAAAIGWAGWGARVAGLPIVLLAGYALLAGVAGDAVALVAAPLLPLGLVALPDAARDLWRAALDRRRITVTRVTR